MTSDSASRVTRSRRSLLRSTLLFIAVLAGVTVLRAQETAPSAPRSQQAPVEASATSTEEAATPDGSDDTKSVHGPEADDEGAATEAGARSGAQDGKPAGKVGPTQDHFEPTEKVRADFDVSFPVDI